MRWTPERGSAAVINICDNIGPELLVPFPAHGEDYRTQLLGPFGNLLKDVCRDQAHTTSQDHLAMIDSSSQIISEPRLHNLILPSTSGGREGPAPRLVVEEEDELSAGVTPEKITSFPGQPMELFPDIMPNKHQVVQKESYGDVLMRRINEPECEPATKEMSRACEDSFEHRISKLELDLANQIEHEKEDMLKLSDGTTVPAIDIERILKMHLDVAEHVMVVGSGCDILCCMLTLKTKVSEAAASGEDPLGTAKDELSDAALALARQHGSEATTVHKARTCSKFCVEGLLPLIAKANAEINVSVQQVIYYGCLPYLAEPSYVGIVCLRHARMASQQSCIGRG